MRILPVLLLTGVLGGAFALPANAETMRDPTRPPDWQEDAGNADSEAVKLEVIWQKGSGKERRRVAVISGVTLKTGDAFRDMTVKAIHEYSVVLEGAEGEIVLYLAPSVEKITKPPAPKAKGKTP
ncbi:MAG: hypothetical protein LBG69_03285 [Zoogloeaceae bacterium]|jgi:hypothetical protein|nr:hypothetical protein [Zoogloeaceae bacterium]